LLSGIDKNSKKILKKPLGSKPKPLNPSNPFKTTQVKKRQLWRPEEDAMVMGLIQKYGQKWRIIAKFMENRTGKQIRDRYLNILMPDINKSSCTNTEDELILSLYEAYGPRWCQIAQVLKGRTESQVKNRFQTHLKGRYSKRLGAGQNTSSEKNSGEERIFRFDESPKTASTCSESPDSLNFLETVGKEADFVDRMFSFVWLTGLFIMGILWVCLLSLWSQSLLWQEKSKREGGKNFPVYWKKVILSQRFVNLCFNVSLYLVLILVLFSFFIKKLYFILHKFDLQDLFISEKLKSLLLAKGSNFFWIVRGFPRRRKLEKSLKVWEEKNRLLRWINFLEAKIKFMSLTKINFSRRN